MKWVLVSVLAALLGGVLGWKGDVGSQGAESYPSVVGASSVESEAKELGVVATVDAGPQDVERPAP